MMEQWIRIAILYGAGALVLLVDLFVPSYGFLLLIGLGLFGYGLYGAFTIGMTAGVVNAIVLMIALPVGFVIAIRNWHRTPVGRWISPPNPKLTDQDRLPVSDVQVLVGAVGRTMGMLRPVGVCEFGGKRVECKAEYGVIETGVQVEAVGLSDRTVVVRAVRGTQA
jgi:membrane-bound serine protease (ClpP class)